VVNGLSQGCCISLFPEGRSYDTAQLLDFMPGVALMTLKTIAEGGPVPSIIPTGIHYENRQMFRSGVVVEHSDPYVPSQEIISLWKLGENR